MSFYRYLLGVTLHRDDAGRPSGWAVEIGPLAFGRGDDAAEAHLAETIRRRGPYWLSSGSGGRGEFEMDADQRNAGVSLSELWGIAFEAAGAATAPFMRMYPKTVMPSEEVSDGVRSVLADHGFEDPPLGYRPTPVAALNPGREVASLFGRRDDPPV